MFHFLFLLNKINFLIRKIYSLIISKKFNKVGNGFYLGNNCDLIGPENIMIGENVTIGNYVILNAWKKHNFNFFNPEIIIGSNTYIGDWAHISSINRIHIGDNVLIGRFVLITDNSHGEFNEANLKIAPKHRSLYSKGEVYINDYVWIGDKVTILPGITIGRNSIIGSNSVITKNVEDNVIVAGNPAKVIKKMNI